MIQHTYELAQPISTQPGKYIHLSIADGEEDFLWYEAAKKHFLEAYDGQDAMYDGL